MPKEYWLEEEVAELLHISKSKLRRDRRTGKGLPYVTIGRTIRYPIEQVSAYLNENTVNPGK